MTRKKGYQWRIKNFFQPAHGELVIAVDRQCAKDMILGCSNINCSRITLPLEMPECLAVGSDNQNRKAILREVINGRYDQWHRIEVRN